MSESIAGLPVSSVIAGYGFRGHEMQQKIA